VKIDKSFLPAAAAVSLMVFFAGLTFSSALAEISFVTSLLLWAVSGRLNGFRPVTRELPVFLCFLAWCGLTLLWSEFPKESLRGFFKVFQQVLVFWMVRDIFYHEKARRWFEPFFTVLLSILILDAGYQYVVGRDLIRGFAGEPATAGYRVTGPFKAYGLFASFLAVCVPFAGALSLRSFQAKSKVWLSLAVLTLAAVVFLFLTRTRTAMVALPAALFVLLLLKRDWKKIVLLCVLGGAVLFALPRSMVIHLDAENREQSLVERFYLWDRAVSVIRAKPLTGTGINTYTKAHQRYDRTKNWRVQNYYAHNGYLQMAAETGIPGALFFLTGIGLLFVRTERRLKNAQGASEALLVRGAATGVIAFLVMSLGDTIMHNNQSVYFLWFFMGLCMAYAEALPQSSQPA